jgi:hypothetical protein
MGGAGAGIAVNADRTPVAWPLRRRHRGDGVRIVGEPNRLRRDENLFQADGNAQALRSCLEDNEVPEAAQEAGCGI